MSRPVSHTESSPGRSRPRTEPTSRPASPPDRGHRHTSSTPAARRGRRRRLLDERGDDPGVVRAGPRAASRRAGGRGSRAHRGGRRAGHRAQRGRRRPRRRQQVGSALRGALEPLGLPPCGDRRVVAGQAGPLAPRVGAAVVPGGGPGVDGVLEQPVLVGLLDERRGVADHPRQEPGDRLDHREDRDLAAVQDVVAERDDGTSRPSVSAACVVDPLVDPLVAAAARRRATARAASSWAMAWVNGTPPGPGMTRWAAARPVPATRDDVVERLGPRLGPHDHPRATAVGRVVDGAVPVVGEVTQVVDDAGRGCRRGAPCR